MIDAAVAASRFTARFRPPARSVVVLLAGALAGVAAGRPVSGQPIVALLPLGLESVFADGFESGGLGGWSSHLP